MIKKKKKKKERERRSDGELRRTSLKGRRPASSEILRAPRASSTPIGFKSRYGDNDKWNAYTLNIHPDLVSLCARGASHRSVRQVFHPGRPRQSSLKAGFFTFKRRISVKRSLFLFDDSRCILDLAC